MTTLSFPAAKAFRTTARQSRRFVIAKELTLLLLFNLHAATIVNSASCNVLLEQKCAFKTSIYNATTILQLSVDGAALWKNYDANVKYHWGGIKEDTKFSGTYNMADNTGEIMEEIARTHTWLEPGEYYSGYTVTFDESVGCDTTTHVDYWLVYFYPDDRECGFMDVDGSNFPTASVAMSAVDEEFFSPFPTPVPTTTGVKNTGAGTADAENTPIPSPISDISPPIGKSETSFGPTSSETDPLRIVEVTAAIVGAVAALVAAAFALARWKNKNISSAIPTTVATSTNMTSTISTLTDSAMVPQSTNVCNTPMPSQPDMTSSTLTASPQSTNVNTPMPSRFWSV